MKSKSMDKKDFDNMIKRMDGIISKCKDIKKACIDGMGNITIAEGIKIVNLSRCIESQVDKIAHDEIYHILGMGDMNKTQTETFIKKFRVLGSYRPYIKTVSSYDLKPVPGIPGEQEYDCKVLGVKLKGDV